MRRRRVRPRDGILRKVPANPAAGKRSAPALRDGRLRKVLADQLGQAIGQGSPRRHPPGAAGGFSRAGNRPSEARHPGGISHDDLQTRASLGCAGGCRFDAGRLPFPRQEPRGSVRKTGGRHARLARAAWPTPRADRPGLTPATGGALAPDRSRIVPIPTPVAQDLPAEPRVLAVLNRSGAAAVTSATAASDFPAKPGGRSLIASVRAPASGAARLSQRVFGRRS